MRLCILGSVASETRLLVIAGSRYYAYMEASQRVPDSTATLDIEIPADLDDCLCMSLYYHMYGEHIGRLTVMSVSRSGATQVLWEDDESKREVSRIVA